MIPERIVRPVAGGEAHTRRCTRCRHFYQTGGLPGTLCSECQPPTNGGHVAKAVDEAVGRSQTRRWRDVFWTRRENS